MTISLGRPPHGEPPSWRRVTVNIARTPLRAIPSAVDKSAKTGQTCFLTFINRARATNHQPRTAKMCYTTHITHATGEILTAD